MIAIKSRFIRLLNQHRSCCRLALVLTLIFILSVLTVAHADKVLYVKLLADSITARSDVWQKDLVTGKTSLLVSHNSMPRSFKARIETVVLSPDGAYLLIGASDVYVVTYKNGKTEYQYGSGDLNGSVKDTYIDSSYWVWGLKDHSMRRIKDVSLGDSVAWDTGKPRLLIAKDADYSEPPERLMKRGYLQSYDPATGTVRTLLTFANPGYSTWSIAGGLRLAQSDIGNRVELSRILQIDMKGRSRALTTHPKAIKNVCPCKTGDIVPSYMNGFIYLTSDRGTTRFRVDKDLGDSWTSASFNFDKGKKRLAALYSCSYGPGHLCLKEHLWIIDTRTCKPRLLAHWDTGGMWDVKRSILAWTSKDDGLIVQEDYDGGGYALSKYIINKRGVSADTLLPATKLCIWTAYQPD